MINRKLPLLHFLLLVTINQKKPLIIALLSSSLHSTSSWWWMKEMYYNWHHHWIPNSHHTSYDCWNAEQGNLVTSVTLSRSSSGHRRGFFWYTTPPFKLFWYTRSPPWVFQSWLWYTTPPTLFDTLRHLGNWITVIRPSLMFKLWSMVLSYDPLWSNSANGFDPSERLLPILNGHGKIVSNNGWI